MNFSKNRIKFLAGLVFLSLLFVILRIKTLGHLLMWDEAWNILSLRAYLLDAVKDPFYWYYRFHPPLYMFFAKFLFPFKSGFDVRAEMLSLLFSYLTFVIAYLLSARIGGWKYAWFSGFFLCLMPASIGYDTWIKRDGLAICLGYLALYLLMNRKFLWCAIALSFSLLSKENALFFILCAILLVFVFKERNKLKILFTLFITLLIVNAWWYLPLSTLTKDMKAFYFSREMYGNIWVNAPLYYLKKLMPDLGPAILFFFIAGLIYLFLTAMSKKQPRWLLPAAVFFCVYIPGSLFMTKTPWLCLSARPAIAMIAASGVLFFLKNDKKKILLSFSGLFLILAALNGLTFSYPEYHGKTYPNGWPGAQASRELALYLNEHMKDQDRLMISEFTYWQMPTCPIFLYYWKPHKMMIINSEERTEDIIEKIKNNKISWLVIVDSPDPKYNLRSFAAKLQNSLETNPRIVRWSYVWNTEHLWKE